MNLFGLDTVTIYYQQKPLAIDLPIYEVFKRIYSSFDTVFFLESLGELGDFSRYSIIGFSPRNHITAINQEISVDGITHKVENPFYALRDIQAVSLPQSSFCGGLVGYITYEGTRYFEPTANFKQGTHFPDFEFGLYTDGIMYDKKSKEFYYFFLEADRSELVYSAVRKPVTPEPFSFKDNGPTTTKEEHREIVETCLDHIKAGNVFQIIASVQFSYQIEGSLLHLYEKLREINPSPHMFFFKFGKRQILGASPELVVRFQVDHSGMFGNRIENFPLAGTTARGLDSTEDAKLASTLLHDEKEKAEHMMLVDLGRNDIGRVCKFGTVAVTDLMAIKRYSHVQHIASEIEGEVGESADAFDCIAATCPMGTVTGAPKVEAMKIANRLEKEPRGPYSGEIGYISFNGDCAFCVGLRSFFADGSFAYTQQGGGIVFDSTPEYEYQEIVRKGAGMTNALQQTVQKSTEKTRKDYTLEELRVKIDDCGARLVQVLSSIHAEASDNADQNKKPLVQSEQSIRSWIASIFHSCASGLTDEIVKDHFEHITPESEEVDRIINRTYFSTNAEILEYFDNNPKLTYEDFEMISSFVDLHRHDLLEVLQERFFWIQHVAYFKKERRISLRKKDREQYIITKVATTLQELGINPRLAWLLHIYIILPIAFEIELLIGVEP